MQELDRSTILIRSYILVEYGDGGLYKYRTCVRKLLFTP